MISKLNYEVQKQRRENQNLKLKLQVEAKNNQILVKNMTKLRRNYFG